jgi:hypothetical protein
LGAEVKYKTNVLTMLSKFPTMSKCCPFPHSL